MSSTPARKLRIAIAIATTGRAKVLVETLPSMLAQQRPAERVIVVAVHQGDVEGVARVVPNAEILFAPRGLCAQRNVALAAARTDCDLIVFFDDDFVPSPWYLTNLEALMLAHPDVVAATGALVLDGVHSGGATLQDAQAHIERAGIGPHEGPFHYWEVPHLYGCNMAARLPAAAQVSFDERLPLYAWQEDRDFSHRLERYGAVVRTRALTGAHLGVTLGRTPGVRLGYSQVANPLYLLRKGTMRPVETAVLVGRNMAANIVKVFRPEPWVDRTGRLRGNLRAVADVALGRDAPERILQL